MAKTKPKKSKSQAREKSVLNRVSATPSKTSVLPQSPVIFLSQSTSALQQGDIDRAISLAKKALALVDSQSQDALPALNLLGEIHVELGDIDAAREYFLQAANIDSDGAIPEEFGGGAEKFLWLAQLSEQGGADSVGWFEKGAQCLRAQIQQLLDIPRKPAEVEMVIEDKKRKLGVALCGVVEVYMTDLSWEEDAEQRCESLVTEATMVSPGYAEPWQTLANVRLSQDRSQEARAALKRSLELWKDLSPGDEGVPDFPTRVSLARLLMEAEMEDDAIEVLERLVGEDDESIETWYLGGWGLYIMGEKQKTTDVGDTYKISWISSRQWLNNCMRLFELQDYEDEKLGNHAKDLIAILDKDLGGPVKEGEIEEGDDWEDEDGAGSSDEEDDEMND